MEFFTGKWRALRNAAGFWQQLVYLVRLLARLAWPFQFGMERGLNQQSCCVSLTILSGGFPFRFICTMHGARLARAARPGKMLKSVISSFEFPRFTSL